MEGKILTLSHYKDPLKPIEEGKGFGYYGALSLCMDEEMKLQCHICGKLFHNVSVHSRMAHKMNGSEYKKKFQLASTTALVSEPERLRQKERVMKWWDSLTPERQQELRESGKKAHGKGGWKKGQKVQLETKNKLGNCPDQLLDKIRYVHSQIGHAPTANEFITVYGSERWVQSIYRTFGSWSNAVRMAGYKPASEDSTRPKGDNTRRYSDEELLDYLTIYYYENGKIPTATDGKRGLIPNGETYRLRFGSLPKARNLAGLPA